MSFSFDDPRIAAGMTAQFALRQQGIAGGAKPIGWKVGFGSEAAMQKLEVTAPLVGFLLNTALVESGDAVSIAGWKRPVAEPEVAVHIGKDLPGEADEAAVQAAIAGLSAAIELADLNLDPDRIEPILSGDIFQRHVIVGAMDSSRRGGSVAGLCTRVIRNGEETASNPTLESNTGRIVTIVHHVAEVLARCGERLKAGDFIIAGSITPPLFLTAEDRELTHNVEGLGSVSVRFAHG